MLSYRIRISLEEHCRDEEITSGAKIMPIREVMREMKKSGGIRDEGGGKHRAWLAETTVE